MLLLTDHEPNCTVGSSLNPCDDAMIQAERLLNMESATTNVLAIGLSNDNPNLPFNGCLDQIGQAGGAPRTAADGSVATTAYYPIASTTSLNDTLKAIINPAACRFYIKASSFDRDNMTITVDGNAIPSDRKNGWAFEDSASSTATYVTFAGQACLDLIDSFRNPGAQGVSFKFCPVVAAH